MAVQIIQLFMELCQRTLSHVTIVGPVQESKKELEPGENGTSQEAKKWSQNRRKY